MQVVRIEQVGVFVAALLAAAAPRPGQAIEIDRQRYMPLAELRPGMKGFGKTVLQGTKIDTFEVEVISVVKNVDPRLDMILVRCAKANLEHTGIIAGMSGSPVYINDARSGKPRLVGAVAFGGFFNKDPICGLQPIEQMLEIAGVLDEASDVQRRSRRTGAAASRRIHVDPEDRFVLAGLVAPTAPVASELPGPLQFGLRPLSTPVAIAGAPRGAMEFFREALRGTGLVPVVSGSAPASTTRASAARLEPGAVLSIPFITGDIEGAAIGTVTEIIGNKVLAFGHPLLAEGRVELPFATGLIHGVIPSLMRSTKVGSALQICGVLVGDESTGVFGYVGREARMVPLTVTVHEPGRDRAYSFRCLHHEMITPTTVGGAVLSSVLARADLPVHHTLRYTIEARFDDLGTYRAENLASLAGVGPARSDLSVPLSILMDNEFGRAKLRKADVDVVVEPVARAATIEQVELARDAIQPGEDLEVTVTWRRYRDERTVGRYTMKVPADLPEGTYEFSVCSWREHLGRWRVEKPHLFRYRSLPQMLNVVNRVAGVRRDRLFLRLKLPQGGVALQGEEMPELPSFRRQVVVDSKRTDVSTYTESIVAAVPLPFDASGARSFKIRIDKRADQ